MTDSHSARPICLWLDQERLDIIDAALRQFGWPQCADDIRAWASDAPADATEAVLDVLNTTGVEPKPLSRFDSNDVARAVLDTLGAPLADAEIQARALVDLDTPGEAIAVPHGDDPGPTGLAGPPGNPDPQVLPEALRLARESRVSDDPMLHPPNVLWKAAQVGLAFERPDLYRHAMIEAGHIVSNETGEPYVICPECGWRP